MARVGPWATRLVGRGDEIAQLETHRRRAAAGAFGCVLVTGEPGMGKSRLVAELVARNRSRVLGLMSRAYPLGAASSFGLWAKALLEEAAEVFGICGAAGRRDAALETLRGLGRPGRRRAAAARGPSSLTRREREVAGLAVTGKSTRDIAAQLGIGERTVETHLDNVYAKLRVDSRLELFRHAADLTL